MYKIIQLFFITIIANYSIYSQDVKTDPNAAKTKSPETSIKVTTEIVSGFIWRGMDFSGEASARRNNESYKSFTATPSFQPTIVYETPLKGFSVELWGNFQLTDRANKDNDYRYVQNYPGGPGPVYPGQISGDKCIDSVFVNRTDVPQQYCAPAQVPGLGLKPYKEQNGMKNLDGLFYAFYFTFDKSALGTFTTGFWFYNTFNRSPNYQIYIPENNRQYPARLAWQEYYIMWKLPVLEEYLDTTLSFYTQVSSENFGINTGRNYASLKMSHKFFEDSPVQLEPSVNVGYTLTNNNIDNRNGVQDITSMLKLYVYDFFIKATYVYRPNTYLYDSESYYGVSNGLRNTSNNDGKITNPSRINGPTNQYALDMISYYFPNQNDPARIYLRDKWTQQRIPQSLSWIGFGYSIKF